MAQNFIYGIGGYCEDCNPEEHGHPLHNLISIEEIADPEPEVQTDAQQIADALAQLPQETLDALKNALGL